MGVTVGKITYSDRLEISKLVHDISDLHSQLAKKYEYLSVYIDDDESEEDDEDEILS